MEILPFIEAIGFDFSVVGLLVAVTIGACWGLAARVNVSPLTAALTGVTLLGRRVRQGSVGEIAAIAFLVAVAGMVANAVADGIFDGEFPLPVIASRPAPVDGTSSTFDASCAEIPVPEAFLRADREEDLIKQDVIRSLCRRAETGSAAYQFLLRYTGEPEAKQLAQLAWAALLEANSAATNGQLRLEYVVVKVMRALALAFFLLFVAAFARLLHIVALTLRGNYAPAWPRVRRRLRGADAAQVDALQTARLESAASSRRTTAAQEAAFAQRAIALLMIVGCVTLTNGFINLWEGQADRYLVGFGEFRSSKVGRWMRCSPGLATSVRRLRSKQDSILAAGELQRSNTTRPGVATSWPPRRCPKSIPTTIPVFGPGVPAVSQRS